MEKNNFIQAYVFMYGGTKKDAIKAFKELSKDVKQAIIDGYKSQCKKAFYND